MSIATYGYGTPGGLAATYGYGNIGIPAELLVPEICLQSLIEQPIMASIVADELDLSSAIIFPQEACQVDEIDLESRVTTTLELSSPVGCRCDD